jgi:hypothetical protein
MWLRRGEYFEADEYILVDKGEHVHPELLSYALILLQVIH